MTSCPLGRCSREGSFARLLPQRLDPSVHKNGCNAGACHGAGEFGRTPKINSSAGRDHWPNVFSVALAGGGIRGGQVIGGSDARGEYPKNKPITPSDLAATIYSLLGIDPAHELHTADGRPVRVAADGSTVISELIG